MNCPETFAYCNGCHRIFNANNVKNQKFEKLPEEKEKYKMTGDCPFCTMFAETLGEYDNERCKKAFGHAAAICDELNGSSSESKYAKAFALGITAQHPQLQAYAGIVLLRAVQTLANMPVEQIDGRNEGVVKLCRLANEKLHKEFGEL